MKKVNELIKELQKHGMATSSDEAAVKAEEIMNLGEKIIPQSDSRAESIVSRDELQSQIEQLKRAFNNLSNDIESLKLALTKKADISALAAIASQQSSQSRIVEPERTQIKIQPSEQKEEKKEPHPRQGNYNPGDVAIDKFFYYGKK